jgi:hypothetical protein
MMFRASLLFFVSLLAACEGDPQFDALFGGGSDRAVVAGGDITIAGPPGYCPDRSATRATGGQSLVVLGSCASVRNNPNAPKPPIPAVLTASVSRANGADIRGSTAQLAQFFRSREGRAVMARNGNGTSVRILSVRRQSGAFLMHIEDSSPAQVAGLSRQYWRALFDLKGRIITVSVIAFAAKPMSDAFARATLEAFISRIRQENASTASEI